MKRNKNIDHLTYNNKGRREELTKLKFKKRLKQLDLKKGDEKNNYALKSHGKPCSCSMCSPNKFKRNKNKINPEED